MGRGQRFTEDFRVEAVRQVTERGFALKTDPPLDLQNLPWDPAQMAGTASLSLTNHKKPVEKEEDEPELARQQTLDQDEHDKQMQAKSEKEIDQLVENLTALYRQKNSKCP